MSVCLSGMRLKAHGRSITQDNGEGVLVSAALFAAVQARHAVEPAGGEEADGRAQLAEQDHVHHALELRPHGPPAHARTGGKQTQALLAC